MNSIGSRNRRAGRSWTAHRMAKRVGVEQWSIRKWCCCCAVWLVERCCGFRLVMGRGQASLGSGPIRIGEAGDLGGAWDQGGDGSACLIGSWGLSRYLYFYITIQGGVVSRVAGWDDGDDC